MTMLVDDISTKGNNFRAKKGNFKGINNPRFGVHLSDRTKKRISEANKHRVRIPHTEETKQKISIAHKTSKNRQIHSDNLKKVRQSGNYGEAWKAKISIGLKKYFETHSGPVISDEGKARISAFNKGRIVSEETRKKLSDHLKAHPEQQFNAKLARKGRLSHPQRVMFEVLKQWFPEDALKMNHVVRTDTWRFVDVAIPSLCLGFEYDGSYWHQDITKESLRDQSLINCGWTIVHIDENGLKYIAQKEVS